MAVEELEDDERSKQQRSHPSSLMRDQWDRDEEVFRHRMKACIAS